jgi:hypothetical protein
MGRRRKHEAVAFSSVDGNSGADSASASSSLAAEAGTAFLPSGPVFAVAKLDGAFHT